MGKIKRVEDIVKKVLENNEFSRGDDFFLVLNVYGEIQPNIREKEFAYVLSNHKFLRLPSFESITRARRKLQSEYPDLRPKDSITDIRYKEYQNFRNYALDEAPF